MNGIKKQLRREADALIDTKRLKSRIDAEVRSPQPARSAPSHPKRQRFAWRSVVAFASVICIVAIISVGLYLGLNKEPKVSDSYVSLDINPSFEINANADDIVTKVVALNKDGQILLYGKRYIGKSVTYVCKDIVATCVNMKFIGAQNKDIKLLAVNDNPTKEKNLIKDLRSGIGETIDAKNINANLVIKNSQATQNGKKKSNGKQALIKEAVASLRLSESEAKKLTVGELNRLLKNYDKKALDDLEDLLEEEFKKAGLDDLDEDALEDELDKLKDQWKEQYGDDDDDEDEDDDKDEIPDIDEDGSDKDEKPDKDDKDDNSEKDDDKSEKPNKAGEDKDDISTDKK